MSVVLYSTNCPKCMILEKKLSAADVDFQIETDVKTMRSKGFLSAPMLEVDGKIMDFGQAIQWVNKL